MAVFAIGDIHGCYQPLRRLLGKLRFNPQADRLWLVGDVVNRGADSLETLRFLYAHRHCITLTLGNHDLHLLALAAGAARLRRGDTVEEVLAAADADTLCDWLRQQPLAHCEHGWLMVHAGVLPAWSAAQSVALAGEVQEILCRGNWREFMHTMYGNKPKRWKDTLQGEERWRVIVNALTRLRICTPEGKMKLKFSGAPKSIPHGYVPWFEAPARQSADTAIVCGHWSGLGLMQRHNVNALDSGCLWGGELTALCLDDGSLHQVGARNA